MDALPATALEVIPAEFCFCLAEACFDLPATEGNAKQFADRPSVATWNSIAEEVFHLVAKNMLGNDQRALVADQSAMMCLSPTGVPADFPDFWPLVIVFDTVSLCSLFGEARRVHGQVADLAGLGVATCQSWIPMLSSSFAAFWRASENLGLAKPSMKLRRHFANECRTPCIKTVEKVTISTVVFIERPSLDGNAIGLRVVDLIQRDLRLRLKPDVIGNMIFFRRAASPAHSFGRWRRASSKQWKSFAV